MIIYNMRYRGPYEYDKTILNVLQFHNEVLDMKDKLEKEDCGLNELQTRIDLMNTQIESIVNQVLIYKEEAQER